MGILRKTKADFKTKARTHDQTLVKRRRMVKRKMNRYSISAQLHFGGTSLQLHSGPLWRLTTLTWHRCLVPMQVLSMVLDPRLNVERVHRL